MRVFLVFLFLLSAQAFGAGELSGRRAPGFSLPDSNMKQHDLADYRGRIVLIDIIQTTCPHCQVFSRILEKVKQKYGDKVAVLSVVNPPDNTASVRGYIARNKLKTPILFDCGQVAASYLKATPDNPRISVPHLFIIDAYGWIKNDYGYSRETRPIFEGNALFAELDRMLAGASAPPPKR